jgi:hypothetical protein
MNVAAMAALSGVALVAMYIVLWQVQARRPGRFQFDWTESRRWELSRNTVGVLAGLKNRVHLFLINPRRPPGLPVQPAETNAWAATVDLVRRYADYSPLITVEEIHPREVEKQLALLNQMPELQSVRTGAPSVVVAVWAEGAGGEIVGQKPKYKEISLYEVYTPGPGGRVERLDVEAAVSGAILQLTSERKRSLYYTTGHQEMLPDRGPATWTWFSIALEQQLNVQHRPLEVGQPVPPDADMVLIARAQQPFSEPSLAVLEGYLKRGGRLLVLQDGPPDSGMLGFLRRYGADVQRRYVLPAGAPGERKLTPEFVPCIAEGRHPIIAPLAGPRDVPVILAWVSPVRMIRAPAGEWTGEEILRTAGPVALFQPGREPDRTQTPDIQPVAVAIEGRPGADGSPGYRMVVVGSGIAIVDGFYDRFDVTREFILNATKWLLAEEVRIGAPPKTITVPPLVLKDPEREKKRVFLVAVVLMPLLAVTLALWSWWSRRR